MMYPPRRAIPTRAGLFALGAPIVLGVAAVNAGNNLLFILLGATLGAIVLSGVLSERNIRRVKVDVRPLAPPYAGEPARLLVTFSREPAPNDELAYALRVVEGTGRPLIDAMSMKKFPLGERLDVTLPLLDGRTGSKLGVRVFPKRGAASLGPCELKTRYPFGLLEKARDIDVNVDVLVRPRRITVPPELADPRGLARDGEQSSRRGLGLEVYGLREREDRDSLHRIHALRSLTLGKDVVIETAGVERPIAMLGIASAGAADPVAFERALEVACAVLEEWDARGYAVGLATGQQVFEPASVSVASLLDAIAKLELGPSTATLPRDSTLWIVPAGALRPDATATCAIVAADGRVSVSHGGAS
jgi:uncharacterized protein (DUF58 family)